MTTAQIVTERGSAAVSFVRDGEAIVQVDLEGNVRLAPGVSVTEASRFFWEHVPGGNPLVPRVKQLEARVAELEALVP